MRSSPHSSSGRNAETTILPGTYEQWPEAEPLAPQASVATEIRDAMGQPSLDVAILSANVGLYLQGRVVLEPARDDLQRALKINESVYGLNHPQVAITLTNLGLLLEELNDGAAA